MKKIFNFRKNDELGKVIYVDSGQIIVEVTENNLLGKISIGNLVVIETTKKHEFTIGIISRVTRKYSDIIQVIESQKPLLLEQLKLAEDLFKTLQQKAFNGTL